MDDLEIRIIVPYRKRDKETKAEYFKEVNSFYNKKVRLRVLRHYSGSQKPFCVCCAENTYEFLSIDHIENGRGNPAPKQRGRSLYTWLIKNKFPDGFQILCHNCNQAKGCYGECPHVEERKNWLI